MENIQSEIKTEFELENTQSKGEHPHLNKASLALAQANYWIVKENEDGVYRFLNATTQAKYDLDDKELFDELGVLLWDWVQAFMLDVFKMEKVFVPPEEDLDEGKAQAPIFISQDWRTNTERALVLIQGSGEVRSGWWARSVWIQDNLELGSMIPDIEFALK